MRPVPSSRHLLAGVILVAFAAATAGLAAIDSEPSEAQVNIACAALKDHQPDLFHGDPIFGDSKIWLFNTPLFLGAMKLMLIPTNYQDLLLPFKILAGLCTLIFAGGMYGLLYRQCRSWSISVFVAILSCAVVDVLGNSQWGVGSLASITPPTMFLATVPLIVLAFLNYQEQWRVILVFLFIGLMGNVHLVSAMNLTLVLLIVYLAHHRMSLRATGLAMAGAALALAGALPYILYFLGVKASLDPNAGFVASTAAVAQAFKIGKLNVLFGQLLKPLLEWELLWRLMLLAVVSGAVMSRWERYRLREAGIWAWMIFAVLLVSLGFQGASQFVGVLRGGGPPIIDFLRASNLLLLPLMVLLAQGITNLFRLAPAQRRWLVWMCVGLAAIWMIPSDNFSPIRHRAYRLAGTLMKDPDKPRRVHRLNEEIQRQAELSAMAAWAIGGGDAPAQATTTSAPASMAVAATSAPARRAIVDGKTIFVTDRAEFRMLSRHAIVAAQEDVRYIYYLAPSQLESWVGLFLQQQQILSGNAEAGTLEHFFAQLAAQPYLADATHWYIILDAAIATDKTPCLLPVVNDGWGRQFRLYEVDLAQARSAPATPMGAPLMSSAK